MSLGVAFAVLQGTVWVGKNLYYAVNYLINGQEETAEDKLSAQIKSLQTELKEIKNKERERELRFQLDTLRRIHERREKAEFEGMVRPIDPMMQSCPNVGAKYNYKTGTWSETSK